MAKPKLSPHGLPYITENPKPTDNHRFDRYALEHYSVEHIADEHGDIRSKVVPYHAEVAVNQPLVINSPLTFGAIPMEQTEAALLAEQSVNAIPPTYFEQEEL